MTLMNQTGSLKKKAVIIGAGPAGLAAGYQLSRQGVQTVLLEKEAQVGGLSRTICYRGNYFDIGGHRFFTKNKFVFEWWKELLKEDFLRVLRSSRIYYRKKYFDYPLSISNVLAGLGLGDAILVLFSYLKSRFFPYSDETNLERWMINRFGKRLYETFFKCYSEKVWGIPCDRISADWAAERIRGVSVSKAVLNALRKGRRNTIKTFINEFHFPRFGAGMMYEAAARDFVKHEGEMKLHSEVVQIKHDHKRIIAVVCKDTQDGKIFEVTGTDFISSMPITSLAENMNPAPAKNILEMVQNLHYRALVMVYLIVDQNDLSQDNWIYVHSPEVKVARIQNFGNWSKDMVANPETSSLAMEYFCNEGDALWSEADETLIERCAHELKELKLLKNAAIKDGYVVRVPKAYPIYEDGYRLALEGLKRFLAGFSNLQCVGRYGMFYYNGMDHSIWTGFLAAKNILGAREDLWAVNMEDSGND